MLHLLTSWPLKCLGFFLCLGLGVVWFFRPSSSLSYDHQRALESYQAGRVQEAMGYLRDVEQIIIEPEGCELVLSVYAHTRKLAPLERWSRRCLDLGKAIPLAAEALAMSLASVGKSQEAVQIIQSIDPKDGRVLATLAQLCIYTGQLERGRVYLLQALRYGEPWSPWLQRVFSARAFYEHPPFLGEVVGVLMSKKTIVYDGEFKILQKLKELGMAEHVAMMEKRLQISSKE